jgi:hypothetical protein
VTLSLSLAGGEIKSELIPSNLVFSEWGSFLIDNASALANCDQLIDLRNETAVVAG